MRGTREYMDNATFLTRNMYASKYGGEHGYFHIDSQCQYVLPKAQQHIDPKRGVLVIGHAGADGVDFVMKPEDESVFAYYSIDDRFEKLGADFETFIQGWLSGSITV